ncbi:MAG: hypothetical protein B7Y39_02500 [Bdellovibrio sp. 28-41-41]|nr:MAG: hypothetical protein B7Y39_02500 [Bdellovibrio sp. 28-41-41]
MASYSIEWRKSAEKEFHKLPKRDKAALIARILDLGKTPRPVGYKKLEGMSDTYRIRYGNFRVLYQIEDGVLIVLIVNVSHRKDVYR